MKANVLLTFCVIAAAGAAVWLAVRPLRHAFPYSDPTDAILSESGLGWPVPAPMTLDEAVAGLSKSVDFRITLDWPQLAAAGVSRDARTPDLGLFNPLTVRSLLKSLVKAYLSPLFKPSLMPPLRFSLTADGALLVSIDHDAVTKVRMYDVRDLLSDAYWWAPTAPALVDEVQKSRTERLINLLQLRLDAGEYHVDSSGYVIPLHLITVFDGKFIIALTSAEHRRLERILASLRSTNSNIYP